MIANSIPSFNFIIIEKLIESLFLCLCLLSSFVQVQSLIQLLVNIWKFYFRLEKNTLFSTHFMILHNFCFLFLNWQQVVNVSHDSQYVAKRKLKCHCIRLHRIIKQIYIDKDNLQGQWAVGALSQVFKNLRTLLSETEQQKSDAYIECWS